MSFNPISQAIYETMKAILQWTVVGGLSAGTYWYLTKNKKYKISQSDKDSAKHTWIIGQTGVGKSTFVVRLAVKDMQRNRRVILIENHGTTSKELLARVPEQAKDHVIYFAPYREDYTISINPMKKWTKTRKEKYIIAENLIEVFQKLFRNAWGHYTEDLIRMSILACLELEEETTLWEVYKIISDDKYREYVISQIEGKNKLVEHFWKYEFDKLATSQLVPPLTKLRKFLSRPVVSRVLCTKGETNLDLYKVMKENHFIADLDKEELTKPVADLLASFLTISFQIATFRRKHKEKFVSMYYDEFQEFVNPSFPVFLSECRKFNVGLTLIHQYIGQLPDEMIKAIKGNVGTYFTFRVGSDDSGFVSRLMKIPNTEIFEELPDYTCYVRLMKNGRKLPAFEFKTPEPLEPNEEIKRYIINRMRKKFRNKKMKVIPLIKHKNNALHLDD